MRRFDMYVPENLTALLEYLNINQTGVRLIANGSDLINRIQRRQIDPKVLVDLSGLSEFNYVKKDEHTIRIGALTTISDLTSSPIIDWRHAVFQEVAEKFGGPSIRNVATVGGNICAASSSEDLLPVLLVLDAQVRVKSMNGDRVMRLEDFLVGKRAIDLKPNEILVETIFQELDENSACSFEKLGMRNSLIIAFVNSAVYLNLDKETKRVNEIRVAFNRVAGKIPQRVKATEAKLRGHTLTVRAVDECVSSLKSELQLSSDFRVSGEYRMHVACALFKRALNRCVEKLTGERIVD